MLSIQIAEQNFNLDVITVRKLNQTMAFKTKFEVLQAQNKQEEMIDAMLEYIVQIFSIKKGEEVVYAFDKDFLLDNLPLQDLHNTFNTVITGILSVFGSEAEAKK